MSMLRVELGGGGNAVKTDDVPLGEDGAVDSTRVSSLFIGIPSWSLFVAAFPNPTPDISALDIFLFALVLSPSPRVGDMDGFVGEVDSTRGPSTATLRSRIACANDVSTTASIRPKLPSIAAGGGRMMTLVTLGNVSVKSASTLGGNVVTGLSGDVGGDGTSEVGRSASTAGMQSSTINVSMPRFPQNALIPGDVKSVKPSVVNGTRERTRWWKNVVADGRTLSRRRNEESLGRNAPWKRDRE